MLTESWVLHNMDDVWMVLHVDDEATGMFPSW